MKLSLAAWAVGVVPITTSAAVAFAAPGSQVGGNADAGASTSVAAPTAAAPPAADASAGKRGKKAREPRPDAAERRARYRRLPWIRRYAPQRNTGELGVFAGVFIPSEDHDLYDPATRPPEPFWRAGADVGARAAFYPLKVLGAEVEFSAMPSRLRNITNDFAFVYGFQAHVVLQLPYYNVIPFFLAGGGLLGVRSSPFVLGRDVDPAFHYGGGVKVNLTPVVGVRVDVRNIVSSTEALQGSGAANVQVLGGLSFTLGRRPPPAPIKPPPPEDPDRDKDGILNLQDDCPDVAGVAPHGCPDSDGDGFRDAKDKCPEVPGVAPDGCPVKDTDNDGFLDPDDGCVFEPETKNGFEDDDGCPDELPPAIKVFDGNIAGIEFDFNKDTIRPVSRTVLDKAVAVLKEYPDVRVNIVGHTDDVGAAEFNLDLSRRRAEAVKKYLVDHGIDSGRVTTEGRGSTDPDVPNDSEINRAKNRRIEFEITAVDATGTRPPRTESGKGGADASATPGPDAAPAKPAG